MVKVNNWFEIDIKSDIDIVIFTFGETCDDKEFEEYMTTYKSLYMLGKKIQIIFDTRNICFFHPKYVVETISMMLAMRPIHKKYLVRFNIIANSDYVLGLLNSAFKIAPPVAEYEICKTIEEGSISNFFS